MLLQATRYLVRELAQAPASIGALPRAAPRRTDRLVGAVAHAGFYLALAAAAISFFSAGLGQGTWQGAVRIAIGVVLAGEGSLLLTDWRGARRLLLGRMHARSVARGGTSTSFLDVLRWRLLGPLIALAALAAVCGGLVLIGMGAADVV